MSSREPIVVLIEDDEGHAALIARNLRRAGFSSGIVHLRDGPSALEALWGAPGRTGPMVLLLDLRMPGMDGFQVLAELKRRPETAQVPVIVLTTADDAREVERSYHLGAAAYVTKPLEYGQFSSTIQRLGAFLKIARLPEGHIVFSG